MCSIPGWDQLSFHPTFLGVFRTVAAVIASSVFNSSRLMASQYVNSSRMLCWQLAVGRQRLWVHYIGKQPKPSLHLHKPFSSGGFAIANPKIVNGIQLLGGKLTLPLTIIIAWLLHHHCAQDGSGEPPARVSTAWSTLQCNPQC